MDASDVDPEMAAFMGFASFGTQPAAKKRKYNHRTDAVSTSAASATGANQVALATRTPSSAPAAASATNTDEIALDSDAEPDTTAAAADTKAEEPLPAAAAATADNNNDDDDEEGGASLYSDPTVAPALAHAQSLIDELTVRGGIGSAASQAHPDGAGDSLPSSGASLPRRPEASWGREMGAAPTSMPGWNQGDAPHGGRGGRGGGRNNHHHHQRDDGKPWWEGYYDPKSNENPWAKLEKAAGVEPRGSWALEGQAQTA
ncbi:hypothetical protein CKAH01_05808 [Colletotrichum kahawae]|uniref:Uncharacterized protein n=1 Tax=Colletotrichum kahawae TaxID=34407 RepID=A0AAD9YD77_COLKA|nr:hypothetical protein CKAH01_05808 [Colletotrichum kahawae]